jgi:hypothetical protein
MRNDVVVSQRIAEHAASVFGKYLAIMWQQNQLA